MMMMMMYLILTNVPCYDVCMTVQDDIFLASQPLYLLLCCENLLVLCWVKDLICCQWKLLWMFLRLVLMVAG